MGWLSSNWIWILVIGGFIALHVFGHGHGGHARSRAPQTDGAVANDPGSGHKATPTEGEQGGDRPGRRRGC